MRIPLHDILAELGIKDMTNPEEIAKIPKEKLDQAAERIKARAALADQHANKKPAP